jgi:hypothetical protein
LLCASSPQSCRGLLWESYRKHLGKEGDPILVWQAPTRTMNPLLPRGKVDAALEKDPARNRAEYLAEWRSDLEGLVSREAVEACVDFGVRERPPIQGIRYVGFVDPSGGSVDSFTLAVAHYTAGVAILDCLREVRNGRDVAAFRVPPYGRQDTCLRQGGSQHSDTEGPYLGISL